MSSFRISAPGKVILFGEHAVVYGKTAVAASLGLRSFVEFKELPVSEKNIEIEMPLILLSKTISIEQINDQLLNSKLPKLNEANHDEFYQSIQKFVATLQPKDNVQRASLECFFYALTQIVQKKGLKVDPCSIKVDSVLPIGAGIGSSASFAVCLTGTFLYWSQIQKKGSSSNLEIYFDSDTLKELSNYAYNCEKIMHGKPSGIDNSICTYGNVIEFRRDGLLKFLTLENKDLRIFLVNTKVGRSTKNLVNKVAELKTKYPEIFDKVIDAIDEVSKKSVEILSRLKNAEEEEEIEIYRELAVMIEINQGLLYTCQVSHTSLDIICATAKKYGLSAKLTGAGGGGFAFILIPPNISENNLQKLEADLITNGYDVTITSLSGQGILINNL